MTGPRHFHRRNFKITISKIIIQVSRNRDEYYSCFEYSSDNYVCLEQLWCIYVRLLWILGQIHSSPHQTLSRRSTSWILVRKAENQYFGLKIYEKSSFLTQRPVFRRLLPPKEPVTTSDTFYLLYLAIVDQKTLIFPKRSIFVNFRAKIPFFSPSDQSITILGW